MDESAARLLDELIAARDDQGGWGYHVSETAAVEPTAVAAWALVEANRHESAEAARRWLSDLQSPDGSLGIRPGEPTPQWPTGLAILAWQAGLGRKTTPQTRISRKLAAEQTEQAVKQAPTTGSSRDQGVDESTTRDETARRSSAATPTRLPMAADEGPFEKAIKRSVGWLLGSAGKPLPPMNPPGHDTSIIAWPWVADTHSWIEPTAFSVLALKSVGMSDHSRVRDGVRLLLDRQLPGGGCNYGNTFVLGARLRPHVLPTALSILALADEEDELGRRDPRLADSIRWLRGAVQADSGALSLSWSLIALQAVDQLPNDAESRWQAALERVWRRGRAPFSLALLALAQQRLARSS